MAAPDSIRRITESEYLEIERAADFKSEFFDGEMFAMSGGTRWQSLISVNLGGELRQLLKKSGCLVFESNLRIKVEATGLYTYPDLSVTCEEPRFVDGEMDALVNPTLLVEVLSDSTEAYDRGKKSENYRKIPSLREYLLVSQREPKIDQYVRQSGDGWLLREVQGLSSQLVLPNLGVTVALEEVFAKVQFTNAPLRPQFPRRK